MKQGWGTCGTFKVINLTYLHVLSAGMVFIIQFNFNHLVFQSTKYIFKEYKFIVSQHTQALVLVPLDRLALHVHVLTYL